MVVLSSGFFAESLRVSVAGMACCFACRGRNLRRSVLGSARHQFACQHIHHVCWCWRLQLRACSAVRRCHKAGQLGIGTHLALCKRACLGQRLVGPYQVLVAGLGDVLHQLV